MHTSTRTTLGRRLTTGLVSALAAVTLLAGCSATETTTAPTGSAASTADDGLLAEHGLTGLAAKELIEKLDTMPVSERPTNLIASIRPNEILLSDQQREVSVPMPADEFYVSFAPYLTQTHDCHFHSLTTCKGELSNADVHVTVVDNATGETLVDEDATTFDNGFLGVWLPRDIDAKLTVDHDGRTASVPLSTSADDDATCVTTLQLK